MALFKDPRLLDNLRYMCGTTILQALEADDVTEISLNPDGALWIERYGKGYELAEQIEKERSINILSLVADWDDKIIDALHPRLESLFPLNGARFEGVYNPVCGPGASFSMRIPPRKIFTFADYLTQGVITPDVVAILEDAILSYKNIAVVGGTSSGKTTFCNAVIHCLNRLCPDDRLLILEDTKELQSTSKNCVAMLTSQDAGIDLQTLAMIAMRYAPKRILVGEVRDKAALEMLKLWNTGHPGGITTFHSDSAEEALERLEELVEEAKVGPKMALIGRAIDLVVYMTKTPDSLRVCSEIIKVHGYNKKTETFDTEVIYARDSGH